MLHRTQIMKKLFFSLLCLVVVVPVFAQQVSVVENHKWCEDERNWDRSTSFHCEVREIALPSDRNLWEVDSGINGGVSVEGWDKDEAVILAKVFVRAKSTERARTLSDQVTINTNRVIEAEIPRLERGNQNKEMVSVSYQLFVPQQSNLILTTHNGGVKVENINGDVEFDVLNGGVKLNNMAGWVEGNTTNGGVEVHLHGDSWEGEGMEVRTTNGGVKLFIPDDYSAQLETSTVNGSMNFEIPVQVKGKVNRNVSATLGDGGKTISVHTVNGGVKVKKSE